MTAFVACNDGEPGPHREPYPFHKGIPKANAVYIFAASAKDQVPARLIAGQKAIEHREADVGRRPDLPRRWRPLALRRRFNKIAKEPAPKPSGDDLLDRSISLLFQRRRNRRQIRLVRNAQVFQALPHAPAFRRRLPVQLFFAEPRNQPLRALIARVEIMDKPDMPRRHHRFLCCRHHLHQFDCSPSGPLLCT